MSKTYLWSEEDFESWYVMPADWYAAHGVELLAETAVTATDATAHSVALGSGRDWSTRSS